MCVSVSVRITDITTSTKMCTHFRKGPAATEIVSSNQHWIRPQRIARNRRSCQTHCWQCTITNGAPLIAAAPRQPPSPSNEHINKFIIIPINEGQLRILYTRTHCIANSSSIRPPDVQRQRSDVQGGRPSGKRKRLNRLGPPHWCAYELFCGQRLTARYKSLAPGRAQL